MRGRFWRAGDPTVNRCPREIMKRPLKKRWVGEFMSIATNQPLNVLKPADFASDQEIRWCPGCGDYSILAQMKKVLAKLGVPTGARPCSSPESDAAADSRIT